MERDRPDRVHGVQLRQRGEHPFGPAQRAGRDGRQGFEPDAPVCALGERLELGHKRQREVAQVSQILCIAAQAFRRGGVGIVLGQGVELELERQPGETPLPTIAAADHGGVDEQPLPATRRGQRAVARRALHLPSRRSSEFRRKPLRKQLVVRRNPAFRGGLGGRRCAVGIEPRNFAEREILGEATGREPLGRAGQ